MPIQKHCSQQNRADVGQQVIADPTQCNESLGNSGFQVEANRPTKQRRTTRPRMRRRHAITLLEILISLAVSIVGVFGVFVLIPVAARMAQIGLDLDEAGSVGRSALEQFEVRGMRNPSTWMGVEPMTGNLTGITVQPNESYCIDPEYLARNLGVVAPATFSQTGAWFPANASGNLNQPSPTQPLWKPNHPAMRRISLASGSPFAPMMTEAMAEQFFSGLDDLQMTEPEDKSFTPGQHYHGEELYDPNNPNDVTMLSKRQSLRDKSWVAMLTPRPSATGVTESDLYTLYVVVFKERDINMASQIDLNNGSLIGDTERFCQVANVAPNGAPVPNSAPGLGGGEVALVASQDFGMGTGTTKDIEVSRDEWIMLSQRLTIARTAPNGGNYIEIYDVFRWYRIADVDEISFFNNIPYRLVTIDGPDWVTIPGATGGIQYGNVYGTVVKGVMDVYERTVRLDNRSIWTP